jgi:DNA-directed RNA polymerase subunit N
MIIPVRCFTCGKVLANKWQEFEKRCAEMDKTPAPKESPDHHPNFAPNFKGKILDDLGITKTCCRTKMLGHVNIIDII